MHILIIEDSELISRAIVRFLKKHGHTADVAPSTVEARGYLDITRYDVIVTDRDVQDGDAWSFVIAQDLATRVVFMSGRPPEVIPPAFYYKAQDDISKLIHLIEHGDGA